ncbi:MAG: hypothetical protein HY619_07100 [Thaumarchaeota archaeon]|nr:hypothetical protein [Nitrososphaerota archaeon]
MVKLRVGFNQQQKQLLDKLLQEKHFGETYPGVIRSVFEKWLKEEGHLDA